MRAIADPTNALARGLAAIRDQFQVPEAFSPEVLAAAAESSQRTLTEHVDRTDRPFATLDPASSIDLDQAFSIEPVGSDLLLHYAIADVGWFVDDDGPIDREAWRRGTTIYLPDGKSPLYPAALGEGAASLLPDVDRPAVVFTVRIDPEGEVRLDGAERAIIRSRAKLSYEYATSADLPADFEELARRIEAAEIRRGAARVDPPEQEVIALGEGRYSLSFRPLRESERRNAAMSLAANLAIAKLLLEHRTGLFRTMGEPHKSAIKRLRHTARAFGLEWPDSTPLDAFERSLDSANPAQAAFMLAIRRAGPPASYEPYRQGVTPWHSAVMAPYSHATAPLRRLADRYVVSTVLALCNGRPVSAAATAAFQKLSAVMSKFDSKASQIERAVIDLAEIVMLGARIGELFSAIVTDIDERGARMQLCDFPVVTRVKADGAAPGDELRVRLTEADAERRVLRFERVSPA